MLTHDTQPLIDFVKGNFFRRYGLTTNVHVMFMENGDGVISEKEIIADDLKNIVELTLGIAENINEADVTRIVNLRKYVELTYPDYNNSSTYHILSNIIHGRYVPLDTDGQELGQTTINSGCDDINNNYIEDFTYRGYIDKLTDSKLLQYYKTAKQYEKILIARLLFERRELLMNLRKKHPALGKFLNESNHIENDHVFQLDPRKYLQIPQCFMSQLDNFLTHEIV